MLSLPSRVAVWLACAPVDLRKAFDGLAAMVRDQFHRDPFSGDVFVFFNRRRDRVKLLVWDDNGFWLLYKRLELGTFEAIDTDGDRASEPLRMDRAKLMMLLEGIDTKRARFRRHFTRSVRMKSGDGRDDAELRHRAS